MLGNIFGVGQLSGGTGILLALVVVWSIIWKGLALWKAARTGSKPWFIVLLIINTVGILEILYLYVFSKPSNPSDKPAAGSPSATSSVM